MRLAKVEGRDKKYTKVTIVTTIHACRRFKRTFQVGRLQDYESLLGYFAKCPQYPRARSPYALE